MIRDHLLQWRKNNKAENYADYLESVKKLPVEDRPAAFALWGIRSFDDIPFVLATMHHVERGAKDLENEPTENRLER